GATQQEDVDVAAGVGERGGHVREAAGGDGDGVEVGVVAADGGVERDAPIEGGERVQSIVVFGAVVGGADLIGAAGGVDDDAVGDVVFFAAPDPYAVAARRRHAHVDGLTRPEPAGPAHQRAAVDVDDDEVEVGEQLGIVGRRRWFVA